MNNEKRPSLRLVNTVPMIIRFMGKKMMGSVSLFLVMCVTSVNAQEINQTIKDSIIVKTLDEVVVVSGTNYQVKQTFIEPKVFSKSIQLQQTSQGQISPYLGGFTGNQVDQTINGVRFNNSLFRTGPNQYFSWVPLNFTKSITTSDGGNIGGTIDRKIGVENSRVDVTYDGGFGGHTEYISFKDDKFGVAVNNINNGNVRSVNGVTPHSSYNQISFLGEYEWNGNNKTTIIFSQSKDLERTDKWNGGERINGFQDPKVYTWELQQYSMVTHRVVKDRFILNGSYQNFTENILNGTKTIESRLNSFTVNGEYDINNSLSLYSSNSIDVIDYQTEGVSPTPIDYYTTLKQGLRFRKTINGYKLFISGGYKNVTITEVDPFNGFESSIILSKNGFFGSYAKSLNAPSFLMIKQGLTTGKAEQLPNPNLKQEDSDSYKIGYTKDGLYFDVNYRRLNNAIATKFITPDTIQTINEGNVKVLTSVLSYTKENIGNSGLDFTSRMEYTYGRTSSDQPINKTVPFRSYLKLSKNGLWVDYTFQTKDDDMSENDLNDVRQFTHNKGVNLISLGYEGTYKRFTYGLTLYNLTNSESRVVGSSIDLPKRSLILNFKYRL